MSCANVGAELLKTSPESAQRPSSCKASELRDDTPPPLEGLESLEREADSLWRKHPVVSALTLTTPLWFGGAALLAVCVMAGVDAARRLILTIVAAAAAGRFIIWTGQATEDGFTAGQLALLVLCLDIVWAVVLTWHAGVLFHVPWVGAMLKRIVGDAQALLRANRWLRRATVLGVLAFVMLPISSTGSIGGSLLGRLLGLTRAGTFLTVLLGSLLGGGIMLWGADQLRPWLEDIGPTATYSVIAALVVLGYMVSSHYRKTLKKISSDPASGNRVTNSGGLR